MYYNEIKYLLLLFIVYFATCSQSINLIYFTSKINYDYLSLTLSPRIDSEILKNKKKKKKTWTWTPCIFSLWPGLKKLKIILYLSQYIWNKFLVHIHTYRSPLFHFLFSYFLHNLMNLFSKFLINFKCWLCWIINLASSLYVLKRSVHICD